MSRRSMTRTHPAVAPILFLAVVALILPSLACSGLKRGHALDPGLETEPADVHYPKEEGPALPDEPTPDPVPDPEPDPVPDSVPEPEPDPVPDPSPDVPDTAEIEILLDVVTDSTKPDIPGCTSDNDCAALSAGLPECEAAVCDKSSEKCAIVARPDGTPCGSKDCESCTKGACGPSPCPDDGNPCTFEVCEPGKGCVSIGKTGTACDDGNPCTKDDLCSGGECEGTPDPACVCMTDQECLEYDDGNACNGKFVCVEAKCVVDPATVVKCTPSGQACNVVSCEPATGKCLSGPEQDGMPCNDGDACTSGDVCSGGKCSGSPVVCDDVNPCTKDGCDGAKGCTHDKLSWGSCDDGDACTVSDVCKDGKCAGGPVADCDDGNQCTSDSCDQAAGCVHAPKPEATPCDDGNSCTTGEACISGACGGGKPKSCDDGNPCTNDSCAAATGCQNAPNSFPCDDGNPCTDGDACFGGQCTGTKKTDCDDGNQCTDDSCDPAKGCQHAMKTGPCNDGNPCTTNDSCSDGACKGTAMSCDDQNPCTVDACDPTAGCIHTSNSLPCEDGNPCTVGDACSGGKCVPGASAYCADANPCTTDSCDPASGCKHLNAPDGMPCDDGNDCTAGDMCKAGVCAGTGKQCDDKNPCTDNKCQDGNCSFPPNSNACDDGNKCTFYDKCANGQCGGQPLNCDDGNPCTTDSCDPTKGCVHAPNTAPCNDGNACTASDTCSMGTCSGTVVACDDKNVCTADSCDPAKGCVNSPVSGACNDGNKCTTGDACSNGVCKGGPPQDCDDGDACTEDLCTASIGCKHIPSYGDPCDDGNACTTTDTCWDGYCEGGPAKNCDDGNLCTADGCNPSTGCVHSNVAGVCDDGKYCTVGDACAGGACAGSPRNCDDGNICTTDYCDENADQCGHNFKALNGKACPAACEGVVYMWSGACLNGACEYASSKDCEDGNPCTVDSCSAETGCSNLEKVCDTAENPVCLASGLEAGFCGCPWGPNPAVCGPPVGDHCDPGQGCICHGSGHACWEPYCCQTSNGMCELAPCPI